MSNVSTRQLELAFAPDDLGNALEIGEGVPSAHLTGTVFHPRFDGERWICDCEHFRMYGTPCRHIFIRMAEHPIESVGVRDTSIDAFVELMNDVDSLNERYRDILRAIHERGKPSSDREIARWLGLGDPNSVRPRRNELADKKGKYFLKPLLKSIGKRECEVTGKTVYIWDFTEFGRMIVKDILK